MVRLLLTIAVAVLALAGPVRAGEPQILGVIAQNGHQPLDCRYGACAVDLSTFCLEETAAVPLRGSEYRIAGGASAPVTVVAIDRSGAAIRLPAAELASIKVVRGNRAVRLAIDYAKLAPRGLTDLRIEVGEGVSLIPAGLAARAAERPVARRIALATGPLRDIAVPFVDRAGPEVAAARLLSRLVNAVPDDRKGDVADRQALWDQVLPLIRTADRAGIALAREAFERCVELPGGGFVSFRQCLASHHDMMIDPLNRAYWEASGAGI